ncbi:acetate/propionate family kinase [Nakamurella sp. GG22]
MTAFVLVINSGSSSMKYQLIDPAEKQAVATGLVERIGGEGTATHKAGGEQYTFAGSIPDHGRALTVMQQLFTDAGQPLEKVDLVAVGHRVVHGGPVFGDPVVVDDGVLEQIRDLARLAPLHNPANADGIAQAMVAFPGIPQVAVFDTAFFRDLPAAAATYAIDRTVAAEQQIRRYGFHGTSHEYVSRVAPTVLGRDTAEVKQIVLHLGNGASASAVRFGSAVETSMGLTPLEGLVMGTRSGDVDPGVVFHLLRNAGMSADEVDNLLNRRSGVLGLAGVSDFRDLHAMIAGDDAEQSAAASLALEVYCHRVRKYIGAYLAVLGGVDVISFTAGVGENDAAVRAKIVDGLQPLGIEVDSLRNVVRSSEARLISPDGAAVAVLVVPTNEELAIAQSTVALVS